MITLGATGAAESAAARASFILAFATIPMDKPPPAGIASLKTLNGWVPEVEDIKRTTSAHQNIEQIAVQKLQEHIDFTISIIEKGNQTLLHYIYFFAQLVVHWQHL